MGVALAVLVLAVISSGFVMLMLLPLAFIWLAVAVYTEPWQEAVPAEPEAAAPPPEPEVKPEDVEKPRVMVAGRRRPL